MCRLPVINELQYMCRSNEFHHTFPFKIHHLAAAQVQCRKRVEPAEDLVHVDVAPVLGQQGVGVHGVSQPILAVVQVVLELLLLLLCCGPACRSSRCPCCIARRSVNSPSTTTGGSSRQHRGGHTRRIGQVQRDQRVWHIQCAHELCRGASELLVRQPVRVDLHTTIG
jgi:hypothetical protein